MEGMLDGGGELLAKLDPATVYGQWVWRGFIFVLPGGDLPV